MAWRLHQLLKRGEFDFTERGRISGVIWLAGATQPVSVDLEGTPSGDLAGHRLIMINPHPTGQIDPRKNVVNRIPSHSRQNKSRNKAPGSTK